MKKYLCYQLPLRYIHYTRRETAQKLHLMHFAHKNTVYVQKLVVTGNTPREAL